MGLVRTYTSNDGSPDFRTDSVKVTASYSVQGVDGTAVTGVVYGGILSDDQLNELCLALQAACAGISWVSNVVVTAHETAVRTFTVSDDAQSSS
jgi:hypothetical protein